MTAWGAAHLVRGWLRPAAAAPAAEAGWRLQAELVPGGEPALRLPPGAVEHLGLKTVAVRTAPLPNPLKLPGTLQLDTDHLARVRSRFAGEVVAVGTPDGTGGDAPEPSFDPNPVRLGEPVRRNQLLAVVWSKDLGEKKSELVEALSRLRLDQDLLQRLEEQRGSAPERSVLEAERNVEADRIAIDRARRTLRTWRLTEAEIKAVELEAERIAPRPGPADAAGEAAKKKWARVEVRAPFMGIVLEVNITKGDVVDSVLDLFKIADLSKLRVAVHAPEEEVVALQQLKPEQRLWIIRFPSEPDTTVRGSFDQIGLMIDPNQRTAAVTGHVDNPENERGERKLRVGQLLLAEISLPAPANEVVIPRTALIEQGCDCAVFIQPDGAVPQYVLRKAAVIRRSRALVYLRAEPAPEEKKQGCQPLKPGERVVVTGAVELAGALRDLLSARR